MVDGMPATNWPLAQPQSHSWLAAFCGTQAVSTFVSAYCGNSNPQHLLEWCNYTPSFDLRLRKYGLVLIFMASPSCLARFRTIRERYHSAGTSCRSPPADPDCRGRPFPSLQPSIVRTHQGYRHGYLLISLRWH